MQLKSDPDEEFRPHPYEEEHMDPNGGDSDEIGSFEVDVDYVSQVPNSDQDRKMSIPTERSGDGPESLP